MECGDMLGQNTRISYDITLKLEDETQGSFELGIGGPAGVRELMERYKAQLMMSQTKFFGVDPLEALNDDDIFEAFRTKASKLFGIFLDEISDVEEPVYQRGDYLDLAVQQFRRQHDDDLCTLNVIFGSLLIDI
jgi:hypothetical protein